MALHSRNHVEYLKQQRDKRENGKRGDLRRSPSKLRCYEGNGVEHVRLECPNLQRREKKRNNKSDSDTDSDYGENLRNFLTFTTLDLCYDKKSAAGSVSSSVSESTRGGNNVAGSDDDAGSFDGVDLAKNYTLAHDG
ncbi:hypothetical protein F2Q69_00014644 [Brassica cretica]|uniref:Uncharacterized protein n=1 Tax=Brassica cretica TaxID=69181 RepID=A0A8S9R5W9_BRACR|nr:hypothetical protein F2Q69_00014644 [Brassica cretica]